MWVRIFKWAGISLAAVVVLLIAGVVGLTLWLTPERLTGIVNEQASRYLAADVEAGNVRFTLWSSFPRLRVDLDTLRVRSRLLDSLPQSVRGSLPTGSDLLLTTSKAGGGLDLLPLLKGKLSIHNVTVDSLRLNLVVLNDSLNNFDIISAGDSVTRVPEFYIDTLRVDAPGHLRYRNQATATDARMLIRKASLVPCYDSENSYMLDASGLVTAENGGTAILRDFPVDLGGEVHVRFKPFGVRTDDFKVSLGKLSGRLSLDVDLGQRKLLNRLDCSLDGFRLRDVIEMLPEDMMSKLDGIDADMLIYAAAKVSTPYDLSSGFLPSAEVDLKVPEGRVSYSPESGENYEVSHMGLEGTLMFDGRNPEATYASVREFHASGLGTDVHVSAKATELLGSPGIEARVRGHADLAEAARAIPRLRAYNPRGGVDFDGSFRIEKIGGNLRGSITGLRASSRSIGGNYGGMTLEASGLEVKAGDLSDRLLTAQDSIWKLPLGVDVTADGFRMYSPEEGLRVETAGIHVSGMSGVKEKRSAAGALSVEVSGKNADLGMPGMKASISGLNLRADASRAAVRSTPKPFAIPSGWLADARTQAFAAHSPVFVTVKIPEALRELLARWNITADVGIGSAGVRLDSYPAENMVSDVSLHVVNDSVNVRRLRFASGETAGTLSGTVTNLRQFLLTETPAPLRADLNLDVDTVQFNQLARIWAAAHPESPVARGDKEAMGEGIDTVSMLLPRNLYVKLHATAQQTRYTNLHLYDLLADVNVADGLAAVDTLHITSDFGTADLKFEYDTRDMQDMSMRASVDIERMNVVNFFRNFKKLLILMPDMRNVSGMISAHADARVQMFPNMYVNVPSLWAKAKVKARDLEIRQNEFIRHVTQMLLIPNDGTLHIDDIDILAGVHSNLLQIFPFHLALEDYDLMLMGVNNFDGGIYYHIGVEKWPLRIPFGVNIKGTYAHPSLRFGGKGWHDRNTTEIAAGVMDNDRVNLIKQARRYMGEFVHAAAVYQGE